MYIIHFQVNEKDTEIWMTVYNIKSSKKIRNFQDIFGNYAYYSF
jgi:hypothetical protein